MTDIKELKNHIPFSTENFEIENGEKQEVVIKTKTIEANEFAGPSTYIVILMMCLLLNPMIFTDIGFSMKSGESCLKDLNIYTVYWINIVLSSLFSLFLSFYLFFIVVLNNGPSKEIAKIQLNSCFKISVLSFICNIILTISFYVSNNNNDSINQSCSKNNINYFEGIFIVKSFYYVIISSKIYDEMQKLT